jgi:hypothetical protein
MDSKELQENFQALCNHEEHVHCNKSSIFIPISKNIGNGKPNNYTSSRYYGVLNGIEEMTGSCGS